MHVLTVVGARPQFIKAAPLSIALNKFGIKETVVHSGQHYDTEMSDVFFNEMNIPEPRYNMQIGSGSHAEQTGRALIELEKIILKEKPDWVLVHGDTNTTLAGSLATVKLPVKLAHNEAGLRSFNRNMPEEHNRVITDVCADLLLCPTQNAVNLLAMVGITENVHLVGDVMYDAALIFKEIALQRSNILEELKLVPKNYILATVHRNYNTDSRERLTTVFNTFSEIEDQIVLPIHPRTRRFLAEYGIKPSNNVLLTDPLGFLDIIILEINARLLMTDSGGMQKEAFFHKVPCLTLRSETEWIETVKSGWNRIVDVNKEYILRSVCEDWNLGEQDSYYGDGKASEKIVEILKQNIG